MFFYPNHHHAHAHAHARLGMGIFLVFSLFHFWGFTAVSEFEFNWSGISAFLLGGSVCDLGVFASPFFFLVRGTLIYMGVLPELVHLRTCSCIYISFFHLVLSTNFPLSFWGFRWVGNDVQYGFRELWFFANGIRYDVRLALDLL